MKRKLFSTLLCAFALLLLMGASAESDFSAALVIEEESAASAESGQALETGIPTGEELDAELASETQQDEQPVESEEEPETQAGAAEEAVLPQVDEGFLIDGQPAPAETGRMLKNGVTYVALSPTVQAMEPSAQAIWDGASRTVTVQTDTLTLTAKVDQFYAVANGRYLYAQDGIFVENDRVMIPLRILTEAFDASLTWDSATCSVSVSRGSGCLASGEEYYDQDALFWLSRIIYAESGNQPLKGQMAVGNTIMNRVASGAFPNSIVEVLAQKNQFSTYKNGKLAERTPNESSRIAAMLVLDGGVVEETRGTLYFDSQVNSWAARSKIYLATIGAHSFYC